ncbi:MAG: translation initiation factor [Lentisphaeraceae bacterium]|nr:translation initiation factor [Lentisphaeraceae bacterium]
MAKKKRLDLQSSGFDSNPFGGLDVSFSEGELSSYEEEKNQPQVEDKSFAGGVVRVRLEKKGRAGKSVTVFYDFDKEQNGKLPKLLADLKKSLGIGGKVTEDELELQGDQRKKAAEFLMNNGYKVKGQL